MANPGMDLHNMKVDDVLTPVRQAQIAAITQALGRFRPTKVAVERPKDKVAEDYQRYLSGSLPPSRSEAVQLGFRLASAARLKDVHGIDVHGDFPWDAVQRYAKTHGQSDILEQENAAWTLS